MTDQTSGAGPLRWILIAVVVLCLVALLAWARGEAGDDGRTPGPDDASASVR